MIRRALTVIAYPVVLALALGVVGPVRQAAMASPLLAGLISAPAAPAAHDATLHISSGLPPLWPGYRGTFAAKVSNPASASGAIRVLTIRVTVGDASAACTAENVSIPGYSWNARSATYTARPGHSVSVPLSITMPDTGRDQNACQGARFPIRYALTTETL